MFYGEITRTMVVINKYTLNYFLSDNTMEVKEKKVSNSGFDSFPMLLKRMLVPKKPIMTHYPHMSLRKDEYYTPEDLRIGEHLNIFSRDMQIIDCDEYTKQWYRDNLELEQVPIRVDKPSKDLKYDPEPKYNGYGSYEDSLGSIYALDPKPPMKNEKKYFKMDMHVLRFDSKLISTEPDDETRKFIVSFYCGDDTIQVYELCDRNSGRIGGKFLEKKKHKNPVSDTYYVEKDFMIGQTVYLGGHRFQLNNCDEYTHKYMEDNFDVFPHASIDHVIEKIKSGANMYPSLQDYAIELIKRLDKNGDEIISFDEFRDGLASLNIYLNDHELNTLIRVFDHNQDGHVSVEEFYNTIASSVNSQEGLA
jgi:EF-hand domain-containing protein 1